MLETITVYIFFSVAVVDLFSSKLFEMAKREEEEEGNQLANKYKITHELTFEKKILFT